MSRKSITAENDTVCPVCWESVHSDKPVGVTTGCGHIWHQACYRSWQLKGEYIYESSTATSSSCNKKKRYTLNSHLNCLICQRPCGSFVDLFIRLPSAIQSHKDLVTKLEHEFNTVSRRTQLSLEKEIARRDFEQTWLQEERQLSQVAKERTEDRHEVTIRHLEDHLKELKVDYERKSKSIERRRRSSSSQNDTLSAPGILQFLPNEDVSAITPWDMDQSLSFSALEDFHSNFNDAVDGDVVSLSESEIEAITPGDDVVSLTDEPNASTSDNSDPTTSQQGPSILGVATVSNAPNALQWQEPPRSLLAWGDDTEDHSSADSMASDPTTPTAARAPNQGTGVASLIHSWAQTSDSPNRSRRSARGLRKDAILPPKLNEAMPSPRFPANSSRSRRLVSRDEIFVPTEEDSKLSAADNASSATVNQPQSSSSDDDKKQSASRKRKGSLKASLNGKSSREAVAATTITAAAAYYMMGGVAEYERQRLEAESEYERQRLEVETSYYQRQAEVVEWELQQTEIELEQDELALQQREQRIRMERSRLEESFTSIQRRVEETKQDVRDRQKLTVMEEKFKKYKIARSREEERFEQELEHLKQDEVHIQEREKCEKQRQETEKVRLKKDLNQLVKVMNRLERAKELAKIAEEQSSASQSHETCVVCFEPLVNDDSELGVVECGHTFHSDCWDRWEKSKRRGSSSIPCPLCNVPINNVCVTMRFGSSIYCSSTSSLAKHFQKEEGRWQRRRLGIGFGPTGEASS